MKARDGVALFEFEDGLKLLDVALLNRRIYEERVASGAFNFVEMSKPILLDLIAPEKASTALDTMRRIGIDGELFGQSTLRVTGGDSSIMVAGLNEKVLVECLEVFGDASLAKRTFGQIASSVSADEWVSVLASSPNPTFTNAVVTRLESSVQK